MQVICRVLSGVCMFICMTLLDPCTALRFLYETFCVFLYVCLPFLSYALPMPHTTKARKESAGFHTRSRTKTTIADKDITKAPKKENNYI